ncbi:hypothetical protein [Sinorhizobium sp. BG8]|uniref:hypothetical protein n=1 Tax=Sinorhizobium sp. BG8 TaxID=2613773 RepID=UPI00193DD87F|nr:hypothetical protein [Sinorhizobium sp. BG8]QRM54375.1 hypothetical protein F3Y30_07310 [Sinorhizobium sp. BG8]
MSDAPKVHLGSIRGAAAGGREFARAVTDGISQASQSLGPESHVRIPKISVHVGEGVNAHQLAAAVRREITRAIGRVKR